jgi:hypothetical protein
MKAISIFLGIITILISACASSSSVSDWHSIRSNAEMLQIKDVDGSHMGYNYKGKTIGLADSIVVAFSSIGPTQRRAALTTLQGPLIRLHGASLFPLDAETNKSIAKAVKVNAEPSMIDSHLWQDIKDKHPSMTHVMTTIFQVAEEWRISGDGSGIPYLWSSYVIARTIVVEITTRQIVSEWRQEIQDRSTQARAPEAPERLVFYLKPVETLQAKRATAE